LDQFIVGQVRLGFFGSQVTAVFFDIKGKAQRDDSAKPVTGAKQAKARDDVGVLGIERHVGRLHGFSLSGRI